MEDNEIGRADLDHDEPGPPKKKRRARGPSKGLKPSKPGIARYVEWDVQKRPIGDFVNDFAAHLGHISRTKVSILYEDWHDVPHGLKDTLWEDTRREFNIPQDPVLKKDVLQRCNGMWRKFKCILNTTYINYKVQPKKTARQAYTFIHEETWNDFVKIKTTGKAKETSKKAKEIRKKNKYPHRMGQEGYAQKEPKWFKKGYYSTSSDPSSTSETVSSIPDRTISWVLARSIPDDEGNLVIPDEGTKKVAADIGEWKQKASDGEWEPNRSDDPLARALGTKERSGHVRGCGGNVGHRVFWGPSHRQTADMVPPMTKADFDKLVEARVDERVDERFALLIKKFGLQNVVGDNMNNPITPNHVGSQSADFNPFESLKEPQKCTLAVEIGKDKVIVAEAMIHNELKGNVVHFEKLCDGNIRVSVKRVMQGHEDTPIPVPSSFIQTLGESIYSFIQWQKHLVFLSSNDQAMNIPNNPSNEEQQVQSGNATNESVVEPTRYFNPAEHVPSLSAKCAHLESVLSTFEDEKFFEFGNNKAAFCYRGDQVTGASKEDFIELINSRCIGCPVISVYILALRDQYGAHFNSDGIGCFCPNTISKSSLEKDTNGTVRYMKYAMEQGSKNLIFCPYHQDGHWSLLVICLTNRHVYSFDPKKSGVRKYEIHNHLNNAFKAYQIGRGRSKKEHKLSWSTINCAQQKGSSESGYFIMRYMFEIVGKHHKSTNLKEDFGERRTPYKEDEINEARDVIAEYFVINMA